MTDGEQEHKPDVEPNFENLPAPMGFAVAINELDTFDYWPDADEREQDSPQLAAAMRAGTVDIVFVEMPVGTVLPWHTHEPHTSQIYWVLNGELRTNYKDNDGEKHSIEVSAEDQKLVYLPAGAHNQLESIGDETLRVLSIKENGGTVRGRLEHYVGDTDKHYDPKAISVEAGIDLDPRRGEVFEKQDGAVEEW
jgi:mannose-6-phosphate isomerase-like protein (cupin superfamily)